ncbi:MAG: HPr family phosphocarrier protein [Peptostreptococcaceae bacterium]|nr:HPr family phosphocarrier protein [Peptostreptococcaceae bacterium]
MYTEKVRVINEMGIHAKTASQIIKTSTKYRADIFFEYGDKLINAKSIVGILAAAISEGSEIIIRADGEDEMEAVKKIVALIEEDR